MERSTISGSSSPPRFSGEHPPSRRALYFSFYGGGVAWTMHLIGSWMIAEFACIAQVDHVHVLGVTVISWSLLAVSALLLSLAIAAAVAGQRARARLERQQGVDDETRETDIDFARTGAIMSGIFSLVIVCQMVPIFFFLARC